MLLVTGFVFCKFCIIGMPDFRPPFLCFLNVINYFLLLIKQMCFHQFLCLYRISAGNGIKQFPMFLHKIRALANIFHIFRATNNDRLISIINNLREQFYRYRMEYVKDIRQRSNLVFSSVPLPL